MKKTTLRQAAMKLALLASVLLAPLGLNAQETLTVYENATSNSSVVPFDGWNADAAQHNQLIYPADELTAMDGKSITQMVFYIDQSAGNGTNTAASRLGTWTVSLGETNATTLSGIDNSTSLTQVYQGYFDCSTGTLTLEFDNGYSYHGGNLLVDLNHAAASYNRWYFLGVSVTGASICYGSQRNFLPKVTFSYETPSATPKPSGLQLTNILHNQATLSWTENGSATTWQICVNDDENNLIDVTTNPYTLTGLTPLTTYTVKVRSVGTSENSLWSNPASFPTTAVAEVVGDLWSDDFEGSSCGWELINGTLPNAWAWGTATNNGGTHALYVSNDGGTTNAYTHSNTMIYATKLLNFADSKYEFSYDWNGNGESTYDYMRVALVPASVTLTAGTSYPSGFSSTALPTGWIALDGGSKLNQVTSWQNKSAVVTLAAGNYYMVLAWRNDGGGGSNPPAAVDNVTITRIACPYDVNGLAVDNSSITTTGATVTWTAGDATEWQVSYKRANDAEWTLLPNTYSATSATLTGLTTATTYQVRVRAYCNANDQGSWCDPVSFPTACVAVTTFPWSENFENYTAGNFNAPCWVNEHISGDGSQIFKVYTSTSGNNTTHQLQLPDMSNNTQTKLQLPLMTLPNDNYQFSIDVFRNVSGTYSTSEGVRVYASTDGEIEGATELGFLYRNYTQTDGGVVGAENSIGWYTYEFPIPFSGTCYIILRGESQYGSATYMDNFVVELVPTCRKPKTPVCDSKTAHTATLSWTNGAEGQTAWQIAYSTTSDFNPDEVTPVDVTTNPATISGLTQSITYYAYVRANCGDEDGMSSWCINKVTFSTLAGNNALTGLAVDDITVSSNSATATWNANAANDQHQLYELYFSTDGTTVPTTETVPTHTSSEASYTFTGLTPETEYFVWVRDNCGTDGVSTWIGPESFTTQASCPTPVLNASGITNITAHTADVEWSNYTENTNYEVSYRTAAYFNGVTEEFGTTMPTGWAQYTGLLNENGTATLSSSTYAWSFGSSNGVFDNHARVNIYNNYQRWLVTPALTVPQNGALTFDMALTAFSGTLPAPQTSGTDDKFVVLITTDEMATWTVLRQWDNAGSEYVYNNIPCSATGGNVMIGLGEYVGQTVRIAFYGESTVSNADNNLHIDNVGVGVAVEDGDWETESVTTNSFQLTNLEAETPYDVRVKGYCGMTDGGESDIQTFTTTIACPVPTGLDIVGDATTNSVDLTWTAGAVNQDTWQICLNGDEENLLDVTNATVTGTTVTYTLTGLTSGADYSVKVRANCGDVDGVSLQWTNTVDFTTEASCTEPTAFAVVENSVEAHQAQLGWTAGGDETTWDIYYSTIATEAPVNGVTEPTVGAIAANPYSLTGLDAATTYYVWVRAHCGDNAGQQSPWVGPESFTTPCDAYTVDANTAYTQNFDDPNMMSGDPSSISSSPSAPTGYYPLSQALPACWSFLGMSNSTSTYPQVFISSNNGYVVAGNCLFFKSSSSIPLYAILPQFTSNISDLMLTFTYRNEGTSSSNGTLIVGYMTDPTDASTFTTVLTCDQTNTLTEKEVFFADAPAGSYMAFKYQGGSMNNYYLGIDNVSVGLAPTCRKPSALACDSKTAHTATLSWTNGEEGQTAWQIAYSTTSDFNPDEVTPVDVTTNPATLSGLTQSTTYYAYVRANCGDEDGMSSWCSTKLTFSTLAGNVAPTAFHTTDIQPQQATFDWTPAGNDYETSWDILISEADIADINTVDDADLLTTASMHNTNSHPAVIDNGLQASHTYYAWIRSNNEGDGKSSWVAINGTTFTTADLCPRPTDVVANDVTNNSATIAWDGHGQTDFTVRYRIPEGVDGNTEEFSTSSIPSGWENKQGLLSDVLNGDASLTTVSNYGWDFSNTRVFGEYHARLNIYGQNCKYWLITPEVTLNAGDNALAFDLALTDYGSSDAIEYATGQADDKFVVLITTDNGSTWTTLREWNNSGSPNVYNNIASEGEHVSIYLSSYSGAVKIAFYGESTVSVSGEDNDLHIDNVTIGSVIPAGDWTSAYADNTNEVSISPLTTNTKYEVVVSPGCDLSVESTPMFFTTASVFTKDIEAKKWYAIASPMYNDNLSANYYSQTIEGMTNLVPTADEFAYDLFRYNEADSKWENYKNTSLYDFDALTAGHGYIYRRSEDATLNFIGTPISGTVKGKAISNPYFSYASDDDDLKGFNLMGNPYDHPIYKSAAFGTSSYSFVSGWYELKPEGTWYARTDNEPIDAGTAALIKVSSDYASWTINDNATAPSEAKSLPVNNLVFAVSNNEFSDVAYARFTDGEGLPKIGHLEPTAPALSIPVEGRRYAIANLGYDCQSFDMNLSAPEGEYTIILNSKLSSADFSYIHLIDRATGRDIDMLSNGSYTFNMSGSQAISNRFMVKLTPNMEETSISNFAYWNGSNLVINGTGTLEAFDVLGRTIFSKELSTSGSQISTLNFPATGVYILRLNGQSQKIIVK